MNTVLIFMWHIFIGIIFGIVIESLVVMNNCNTKNEYSDFFLKSRISCEVIK